MDFKFSPEEDAFREDVNIGDKVRITTKYRAVRDGDVVETTEGVEGYVARHGWFSLTISPDPVDKPMGIIRSHFLPDHHYLTIQPDYEVLERKR